MKRFNILIMMVSFFILSGFLQSQTEEEYYKLGKNFLDSNKYEEAIIYFDKTIKLDSNFYNAWDDKGVCLQHLKKYQKAILNFDKAIEINPDFEGAWINKGDALDDLGEYEEAIRCFDKAIEINPKNSNLWNDKGVALEDLKKYVDAIKCFEISFNIKNNYMPLLNIGMSYYSLKMYDKAVVYFDKALKFKPDFNLFWEYKGRAFDKLGKIKEAEKCFKKAAECIKKAEELEKMK